MVGGKQLADLSHHWLVCLGALAEERRKNKAVSAVD